MEKVVDWMELTLCVTLPEFTQTLFRIFTLAERQTLSPVHCHELHKLMVSYWGLPERDLHTIRNLRRDE